MATNALAVADSTASIMEDVIVKGDLAKLSPEQRSKYYMEVCRSVGLNPLTQPFEYLVLKGKTVLYAKKGCADQLRQIHGIDLSVPELTYERELVIATISGRDKSGRQDAEVAAVSIKGLQGEDLSNAIMKVVTKVKRRLTLSMVGLGMLDESEVPDAERTEVRSIRPVDSAPVRTPLAARLADIPLADEAPSKRGKVSKVVLPDGEVVDRDTITDAALKAMSRTHAIGTDRGLDHTALHLLALACGFSSMTDMSESELLALGDEVERAAPGELEEWLGKGREIETGAAIAAEFIEKLQQAPSVADVLAIGTEIQGAGIGNDQLREAYQRRLASLRTA